MSKFLKVSKVLGRQVSKAEGDPGLNYEVQGFRRSLKVVGFKSFLIQGLQGSKGQRVSRHVGNISSISPGNKGDVSVVSIFCGWCG